MSSWTVLTVTQLKQVLQSHDLGADLFKSSKTRKAHLVAACEEGLRESDLEAALHKYAPHAVPDAGAGSAANDNLKGDRGSSVPKNSRLELLAQSQTHSPEKENEPVASRPRSRGPRSRTSSRVRSRTPNAATPGRAHDKSQGVKVNAYGGYTAEDEEDQSETSPIGGGTRVKGVDSVTASQIARQEFLRRRRERMSLPAEARSTYSPTGRTPPYGATGANDVYHNNSSGFKEAIRPVTDDDDVSPVKSHEDNLKKSSKLAFANYSEHDTTESKMAIDVKRRGSVDVIDRREPTATMHTTEYGGTSNDRLSDRYSVISKDVHSVDEDALNRQSRSHTPPRTAVDVHDHTERQHQPRSQERGRSQSRKSTDIRQSSEQMHGGSSGIAPFSTRGAVPMDPAGRPVVWRISSPPKLGPSSEFMNRDVPKRMPSFGSRRSSTGGDDGRLVQHDNTHTQYQSRNPKPSRNSLIDTYRINNDEQLLHDSPLSSVNDGERQSQSRYRHSTMPGGDGRLSTASTAGRHCGGSLMGTESDGLEDEVRGHRKTRSKSKVRSSVRSATESWRCTLSKRVIPVMLSLFKICVASGILAAIVVGLRSTGIFKSVKYCSNTGEAKVMDCAPCPHNAECSGGGMQCAIKFRREWYNGVWTCVRDTKSYEVAQRYLYAVSEHLAQLEGKRACGYPVQSVLSKEDLLVYLQSRKDGADYNLFDTRVEILFDELLPAAVELAGIEGGGISTPRSGVHTIRGLHNTNGEYLYQSAMTMKPWMCRASEFLWKFLGIGIVVVTVVLSAVYWYMSRSRAASVREAVLRVIESNTEVTPDNYASGARVNEICSILKTDPEYADIGKYVDDRKVREMCQMLVRGRAGIQTSAFAHDMAHFYYSSRVVNALREAKKNTTISTSANTTS